MTCDIFTAPKSWGIIDTDTLKILLLSKTPLILLDARTHKWDDGRRIPGAKSLTNESSPTEIEAALPHKEALIVVYCSHLQCGASERLAKCLAELGYTCILKYAQGLEKWVEQGNPIQASSPK